MKEIRVSPGTQLVAALGIVVGVGALAASQYPEIQRYLKIKGM
jgi:hypothetical protein